MNNVLLIFVGLLAGILGGMFGIGGATIVIPALVYFFGFTQHQAQGTTLAMLVPPIGILAVWRYWQAGNVKVGIAGLLCIGFLFGALIGANFIQNIPDVTLKRMFGVFLAIVAVKMIFSK